MIRLADIELPADTAKQLAAWQAAIDAIPGYPQRVEAARRQFAQCNDGRRPAFREVRRHLDALCFGERRCMYCEDSCADEVEHVRPKALFPEHVFAWHNYIYACGPCNGIKRDNFPRLVAGAVQNLARGPRDPVEPPPAGTDLLIDPRAEDPAEFLVLDLETGFVLPRPSLAAMPKHRADQTIAVLKPIDRCSSRRGGRA